MIVACVLYVWCVACVDVCVLGCVRCMLFFIVVSVYVLHEWCMCWVCAACFWHGWCMYCCMLRCGVVIVICGVCDLHAGLFADGLLGCVLGMSVVVIVALLACVWCAVLS